MPKYVATSVYVALSAHPGTFSSVEEALDSSPPFVGLCHSCGRELEVNDPLFIQVIDENGKEVSRDGDWPDVEDLRRENAALKKQVKDLTRKVKKYANGHSR